MADFLADFKRRESSEGSNIDDEEDEPHQFAREEINHQSDEEDNRANQRRNQNNDRSRPYQGEENKDTRDQGQSRNAYPSNQAQNKKKDYYLYQGEEKPYESDPEEEGQGKGTKQKRENLKNKKKDPTYVPKGTFYQHDTRGDETEYVPKKSGGNQGKLKWRHDKFEKGGNKDNGYDKPQKEAGNPTFINKQKEVVYYVAKGANEQKPAEQEPQEQKQQQQQQQQPQRQQQPREDRPQQQSRGKGYNYDKGGYGNDRNDRDRDYNQNSGKYREYAKKDNYKKSGGNAGGGKQDVYYEYVPK